MTRYGEKRQLVAYYYRVLIQRTDRQTFPLFSFLHNVLLK